MYYMVGSWWAVKEMLGVNKGEVDLPLTRPVPQHLPQHTPTPPPPVLPQRGRRLLLLQQNPLPLLHHLRLLPLLLQDFPAASIKLDGAGQSNRGQFLTTGQRRKTAVQEWGSWGGQRIADDDPEDWKGDKDGVRRWSYNGLLVWSLHRQDSQLTYFAMKIVVDVTNTPNSATR